ncbi:MAG: hypothetical protein LBQ00_01240 [Syntrophobacterales bacterium]|nr:hypothetical protein [Syntrophobacterales bacterium]
MFSFDLSAGFLCDKPSFGYCTGGINTPETLTELIPDGLFHGALFLRRDYRCVSPLKSQPATLVVGAINTIETTREAFSNFLAQSQRYYFGLDHFSHVVIYSFLL